MMTVDNRCPLCGGIKKNGEMTFTVDMKDSLLVIRNVPATVCSLCGNEWLSDSVVENIEDIVSETKRNHSQIEVMQYSLVA